MITEFYTTEAVEELMSEICAAEDSIKYIFNIPLDHQDSKLRTGELMEAYSDLIGSCEDLIRAYRYYLEAENYLCKNSDEMEKNAFKARARLGSRNPQTLY